MIHFYITKNTCKLICIPEILNYKYDHLKFKLIERKVIIYALMTVAVRWVSSHKLKGQWFDSWSGLMRRFWVQPPVGAHIRGN